jgi:hypothetical protein
MAKVELKHRPFCDRRMSMKTNVLLQRPKVGRGCPTTQELPSEDFRYGIVHHDGWGVKEIFAEWDAATRPTLSTRSLADRRRIYSHQDFVATNRAAVRAGCISAREFREFKKKHEILVKPEENSAAEDDAHNAIVRRSMTHGKSTIVKSEMKDCLTWQSGRDAVDKARGKQTIRHQPTIFEIKRKTNHGIKPTRASRGHTVKAREGPSLAETFKMKKFLDVEGYAIDDKW